MSECRKIGKLITPEPAKPTPVERLLDLLVEIEAEARKEPTLGSCLPNYWQGKKDGIRIAMIVLDVMEGGDKNNIEQLQITSRKSRYTDGEAEVIERILI